MKSRPPEDWIIWMDADTMFTTPTKKWETILRSDMVFAEAPDVISNNGVFAVRCSTWGRWFIEIWSEECTASPGPAWDNGPFVKALLRAFATTHGVPYDNACRSTRSWPQLVSCYNSHIQRIANASGLDRTRGPNGELGSGLIGDPHLAGAWGINSGLGFKPPNDWHEGDFILNLAGESKDERNRLAQKYAETYTNTMGDLDLAVSSSSRAALSYCWLGLILFVV